MRRFRVAMWVVAASLAALAMMLALPRLQTRLRREIEARCQHVLDGRCTVADVRVGRDGLVATGIHAWGAIPEITADATLVAVRLNWWLAIRGVPQDVDVRLDGLSLHDGVAPEQAIQEFVRLRARRHSREGQRGAFRVAAVALEHASLDGRLGEGAVASVAGLALTWTRGELPEVSWSQASLDGADGTEIQSGRCSIRANVDGGTLAAACSGFSSVADIGSLRAHATRLLALAHLAKTALTPAPGGDHSVEDSAAPDVPLRLVLHAQEGSLRLSHAGDLIIDMRPAAVELAVDRAGVHAATIRLGGDAAGPALELSFGQEAHDPWRIDLSADGLPLRELASYLPIVPWHATEHGQASLRIHVEPAATLGAFVIDGQIAIEDFGLMHAGLSHDPIDGLSFSIRGGARIDLVRHRVETEGLQIGLNGIVAAVAGWFERPVADHFALDASVRLPTMGCDAIRRALPRALTGPIDDLGFAGTLGADVHVALDTERLAAMELQVDVDDECVLAHDALALGVRRLRGPFVQRVQEPSGLRAFITGPGAASWVPLARISPFMRDAVLSREDGRFYRHHGFDVGEIRGAIVRNLTAHRFVYGASTLSMQLAKNIFLAREKTLVRKLQEVVLTWYLEHSLDKDSILELYLNVVEFGPGVYGIGPASRFFFGREPSDLTPLQAIYLATLLPNPTARFANFQHGTVSAGTLAFLRAHARHMALGGLLSPAEAAYADAESLVFRPATAPVTAR